MYTDIFLLLLFIIFILSILFDVTGSKQTMNASKTTSTKTKNAIPPFITVVIAIGATTTDGMTKIRCSKATNFQILPGLRLENPHMTRKCTRTERTSNQGTNSLNNRGEKIIPEITLSWNPITKMLATKTGNIGRTAAMPIDNKRMWASFPLITTPNQFFTT